MAEIPFDSVARKDASHLAHGEPLDPLAHDPLTRTGHRADASVDATAETAGIKREIARTRAEMSDTLGELQERLRPSHVIQQAKDTVAEAATGKMRNIMNSAGETAAMVADQTKYAGRSAADYACAHPVQMALVAGGVTWLLLRARGRSDDWMGASEGWHDADAYDYDESRGRLASARDTVGEYASAAKDTVSGYASSAREAVGGAAESARDAAQHASERVGVAARQASVRARDGWNTASTSVDDWVQEYPLAAGLLALAVGAAIGLSVPGTELEDRAMGERRDQALERARAAAMEIKDNVTQKVQSAAQTVLDVTGGATPASATEPGVGRA